MKALQDLECPFQIADLLKLQKNFQTLSAGALSLLASSAQPCRLSSGQSLWSIDESTRFCAVITHGWIEIQTPGANPSGACTGLFGRGDIIGLSTLFRDGPADGNPVASEDGTTVIKLLVQPLLYDWEDSRAAELTTWVRSMYLVHEKVLQDKIEILSARSVDQKILTFLLHFLRRFGRENHGGSVTIPVPISKSQVARIVDIRVETSIRAINHWQQMGLIRWEPHQVVIPNLFAFTSTLNPLPMSTASIKGNVS